jgi:hypothetical protein
LLVKRPPTAGATGGAGSTPTVGAVRPPERGRSCPWWFGRTTVNLETAAFRRASAGPKTGEVAVDSASVAEDTGIDLVRVDDRP